MKKDNNNNHRISKSIVRISYVFVIFYLAQMQDSCTVRQLIAISTTAILLAPVADWINDWIFDNV